MRPKRTWDMPIEITDLVLAFPADVTDLLPTYGEVPEEFKISTNPWVRIVSSWFAFGLPADVEFHCKPGVDGETAFRQLSAVLRSFQPKHEHKIDGAAYLMSLFFEKVVGWQHPKPVNNDDKPKDIRRGP